MGSESPGRSNKEGVPVKSWKNRKADVIFELCYERRKTTEIAYILGLSPATINKYISKIMAEKGVSFREEICIGE